MTVYTTSEYSGHDKKNYYHNEYREEGDKIVKYKCHRQKSFDGDESSWIYEEEKVDSWDRDDPSMPEWLREQLSS